MLCSPPISLTIPIYEPSDITVYDVSRIFPTYMIGLCTKGELEGVQFVGRKNAIADKDKPIEWSYSFRGAVNYLPVCVTEANYIINLANIATGSCETKILLV